MPKWYACSRLGGELHFSDKLYFPLAEERNKWRMFSHTPPGPGPEGLFFESRAQCCFSGPSYMVSGTRDSPPPKATLSSVYM